MNYLDKYCLNGRTDPPRFDYLRPEKLNRRFTSIEKDQRHSKNSLLSFWNRVSKDKSNSEQTIIDDNIRKNRDTDHENFMNKDSVDAHLSLYRKSDKDLPNYEKMFFETVRMPVRDHLEAFNYSLMNVVSLLGENERSSEVEKRIIPKVIYKKLFLNYPTDQLFSVQKDIVTFLKEYQKKIKMIR